MKVARTCREFEELKVSNMMVMEVAISAMVSGASAAERIVNTPSPFNIVVHMR